MVSTQVTLAPFSQDERSSLHPNLFVGSRGASHRDQIKTNEKRHVGEIHKNVTKMCATGAHISTQPQSLGSYDYFDQDDAPEGSNAITWASNSQSANLLSRIYSGDGIIQRAYNPANEKFNTQATSLQPPVEFSMRMAGEDSDNTKLYLASARGNNNVSKPALNFQVVHDNPLNRSFGPNEFSLARSALSSHDMHSHQLQSQHRFENHGISYHSGAILGYVSGYDASCKGIMQCSELLANKQLQGPKMDITSAKLQYQHQQHQQEHQGLQHRRQQEQHYHHHHEHQQQWQEQKELGLQGNCTQEKTSLQLANQSSTSYYDLLQGPDTPPQCQVIDECRDQAPVPPLQNAETIRSPMHGPLRLWQSGSQYLVEMQQTGIPLPNDWSNEPRRAEQIDTELGVTQNVSGELMLRPMGKDISQVYPPSGRHQLLKVLQPHQHPFPFHGKQSMLNQNSTSLPSSLIIPKTSMQQFSDNFYAVANPPGYIYHNLASTDMDVSISSGKPHCFASSELRIPLRPGPIDVRYQHQSNSIGGFETPQLSRIPDSSIQTVPGGQYDMQIHHLSNKDFPVVSVHSGPSRSTFTGDQGPCASIQASSITVKTSSSGNDCKYNQNVDRNRRGKEVSGSHDSSCTLQPPSEPFSQFQGTRKRGIPTNQFNPAFAAIVSQSLSEPAGRDNCQQHHYAAAMENNWNGTSAQYNSSELVCKEQPLMKFSQPVRLSKQERLEILPTANFITTARMSQESRMIPNAQKGIHDHLYGLVEHQGSSVERQQEIPQQPTSPCTLDLSLAHLRENYSTSSLFSQEFKLGLGPSINSCKPSTASRNCPQTWNPDGGMLHCKSNNETFEQHSIHKRVSETARHKEVEACLGTGAAIRGINVLNGSVSPSVFINASRPGSCDQLSADASSTSSFASAHAIDDSSQAPVNTIPQTQEYNMDGGYPYNPSSSVSQIQRFPLSNVQYSNALIDYSSKDFSTSGNSNLPHYKTAIQPVQSNHSVKLLERTVTDIHMLPGNELNTEDGNTFSAGGLVISANACVSGQSKSKVDDKEKLFSTNDSFQILPDGAQESSGGEHKQHISLETAMLSVNAMNQRAKSYLFQSPRMQHITSNQNNAYKEAETSYEKNPYMANISYSNNGLPSWQAEVSEQASDVSSLPFRQVEVSEQASDVSQHKPLNIHTHHAKFLNVHTSEVIDIGVNLRKPPSGSYSSVPGSAQSQLLRHLSVWKRQTSAGVAFDTMSRICPASNTACSHEVSKCSLLPGKIDAGPVYSDKFPSSQHFTGSQFPAVDVKGSGHHTTMERHNSCSSDNKRVDVNQSVDASSELLKSATVPMVSYSAGVHHCPSSNELKHKPTVPPHESNSSKEDRALSVNNQGPLSLEDTCKEEGSKILAQSPIVIPRIVGPLSPSKISISYPAKKRKRQHSVLIPWHVSAAEAINAIPSNSDVEAMWASALNRLSEKDSNVTHEDNKSSVFQVKRRLKLTTQSMQQLFQPIRDGSSHGTTFADKECDIYIVAKMALEDACRLVAKTNRQAYGDQEHPFTTDMFSAAACDVSGNHPPKKFLKRFMERFQHLGGELARLDCTASASELCSEMHELEQLSIVDRLARHHGLGLVMDTCNDLLTEHNCEPVFGSRKAPPERYVTAIAMPRILPTENTRCLPL